MMFFLLALSMGLAADHDDSYLKTLYHSRQWFKLRDAIRNQSTPAFYRLAVACAFDDQERARKESRSVIESAPKSEQAYEAHNMLAYFYFRRGQYREARAETDAMLAIKPDNPNDQAGRKLFAAFSQAPEQRVTEHRFSKTQYEVKIGNPFIPVSVNGNSAKYMLDTGANISTMSGSEAKRLGLTTHEVSAMKVTGASGAQVGDYRVAVADDVTVGNIRLSNVAFLVMAENQGPWEDLQPGERGALGISVLRAFRTVRFSKDGSVEIGFPSKGGSMPQANLCFEKAFVVVQAEYQHRNLNFVLDSGAEETFLWPVFAKEFGSLVTSKEKDLKPVSGVGGTGEFEAVALPELTLRFGSFDAPIRSSHVLLQETQPESRFYHGLLGWNLLRQASRLTLDFKSMTLVLE